MSINYNEWSFIVRGHITERHKDSLLSIRKYFPQCKIILSTWEDSNINGLEYDILELTKDPGVDRTYTKLKTSQNRQNISAQQGLKHVNTKYCVMLRNDTILENNNMIKTYFRLLDKWGKYKSVNHTFTTEKILLFNSPFPTNTFNIRHYHISDVIFVGMTKDIKMLWENKQFIDKHRKLNINLSNRDLSSKYHKLKVYTGQPLRTSVFTSEQEVIFNAISNAKLKLSLPTYDSDTNFNIAKDSSYTLASNFIFANTYELGANIIQANNCLHALKRESTYKSLYIRKWYKNTIQAMQSNNMYNISSIGIGLSVTPRKYNKILKLIPKISCTQLDDKALIALSVLWYKYSVSFMYILPHNFLTPCNNLLLKLIPIYKLYYIRKVRKLYKYIKNHELKMKIYKSTLG